MFKPMDGASRKGDKLAVLMPGMGAVATTFIAGVGGTTAICYLIGLALLAASRKT